MTKKSVAEMEALGTRFSEGIRTSDEVTAGGEDVCHEVEIDENHAADGDRSGAAAETTFERTATWLELAPLHVRGE